MLGSPLFELDRLNTSLVKAMREAAQAPTVELTQSGVLFGDVTCQFRASATSRVRVAAAAENGNAVSLEINGLDEASDLTLVLPIPPGDLGSAVQLLAYLRAQSTQTLSCMAALRVTGADGRHTEFGARETVIGLVPTAPVLCMDVKPSSGPDALTSATEAALVLRFSARACTLTLMGLRLYAAHWDDGALGGFAQPPIWRQHVTGYEPTFQRRQLTVRSVKPRGTVPSPTTLIRGSYLNYHIDNGQTVSLSDAGDSLCLDLEAAQTSIWRTIELRFMDQNSVQNHGLRQLFDERRCNAPGGAPWVLLLHADIWAPGTPQTLRVPISMRMYSETIEPVHDHHDVHFLRIHATRSPQWMSLDIGQFLPQDSPPNAFGFLLAFPNLSKQVHIAALSAACVRLP